jgi:hypothetical protein
MAEVNYGIIVNFLIIIAIAMMAPIIIDMYFAYKRKQKSSTGGSATDSSSADSTDNPVGMPGLYRTIMTFSIILILAGLVFYFMTALSANIASINSNMTNATATAVISVNRDLIQQLTTISTVLGGAVSAIIGFYFGNRASESGAKAARTGAEVAESAAQAAADRVAKVTGASSSDVGGTTTAAKTASDTAAKTASDTAAKTASDTAAKTASDTAAKTASDTAAKTASDTDTEAAREK